VSPSSIVQIGSNTTIMVANHIGDWFGLLSGLLATIDPLAVINATSPWRAGCWSEIRRGLYRKIVAIAVGACRAIHRRWWRSCATAAITDATPLPFDLPSVRRKKLTVDFDGGNQSSDGGLLLLRQAEPSLAFAGGLPMRCRIAAKRAASVTRCSRW
jgi:hypothetical protein